MIAFLGLAALLIPSPHQEPGEVKHNDKGGFDMVYVPGGDFQMGDYAVPGNQPHTVHVGSFWMGKTPVTVSEFRDYCLAENYTFSWDTFAPPWGWIDDDPMVMVTWDEAQAFCKWAGGTLPSEEQWEKAARGTDGHDFPWGDDWEPDKVWWSSDGKVGSAGKTASVFRSDHISTSPYGCTDMAGNVLQWCSDWSTTPSKDPEFGPRRGKTRIMRGGSWYFFMPVFFRSAYRYDAPPIQRNTSYGFRFAKSGK